MTIRYCNNIMCSSLLYRYRYVYRTYGSLRRTFRYVYRYVRYCTVPVRTAWCVQYCTVPVPSSKVEYMFLRTRYVLYHTVRYDVVMNHKFSAVQYEYSSLVRLRTVPGNGTYAVDRYRYRTVVRVDCERWTKVRYCTVQQVHNVAYSTVPLTLVDPTVGEVSTMNPQFDFQHSASLQVASTSRTDDTLYRAILVRLVLD